MDLYSFLTSDLGAPQPLHISLSRPIVLSTTQKDAFLPQLTERISSSRVGPFDLVPRGLEWHRTPESSRSFLVLKVASCPAPPTPTPTPTPSSNSTSTSPSPSSPYPRPPNPNPNPELSALLAQCNALVKSYSQPPLYAFQDDEHNTSTSTSTNESSSSSDAFHISIAWSFAEPTAAVKQRTEAVFSSPDTRARDEILAVRVPVTGVKAKIGNVVTRVALPVRGKRGRGREGRGGLISTIHVAM